MNSFAFAQATMTFEATAFSNAMLVVGIMLIMLAIWKWMFGEGEGPI
jgi:hypothetical protein